MSRKNQWINLAIFNFCIVAALGVTLRSKILFSMPFLDYNRLLDGHFHFAFGGWVTFSLVVLLVYDVLPEALHRKPVYKILLASIFGASWILLLTSPLPDYQVGSSLSSFFFILVSYVFTGVLLRDIRKAEVSKTVRLLVISSLVSLVLSSVGIFSLAYLFGTKSLNTFAYRDALYTYLHFQYNGFFTLAVFALLFHKLEPKMSIQLKQKTFQFSVLLCISTLLSLFLAFLWRNPNETYRIMASSGSVFLLLTFLWFVTIALSLREVCVRVNPLIRYMGYLAMSAFSLKIFLQSFTIFQSVGNAVFGDRPVIIGFLHLVFLGFVSLFLFTWFAYAGFLNIKSAFTRIALIIFTVGVVLNEAVLMTQGLGAMFIKSSYLFPWLLWGLSILLLSGALLIAVARIKTNRFNSRKGEGYFYSNESTTPLQ